MTKALKGHDNVLGGIVVKMQTCKMSWKVNRFWGERGSNSRPQDTSGAMRPTR